MNDERADVISVANYVAEIDITSRVEAQRLKVKPKQVRNEDGTWPDPYCVKCGEEIGEGRLNATGSDTCIGCAEFEERKGKHYARR